MVLEKIQKENDIKKLTPEELELLKDEIRQFLIESISVTGGHLASNLGVVELTMALHLCFNLPKDKIVWDVGHQSYTHKILTGRKDGFSSLRQYGGMSGFPKADESDCDCFNTGHSSTSISAGLGLATARQVTGDDYHVVSVIGDGALTGGMAYEALNNASSVKGNFIIVLNDNNMSISENVGGISQYLSGFRTADAYRDFKNNVMNSLNHIPIYGERMVKHIRNTKSSIKQLFIPGMFFEEMGIIYLGPVDGSDIKEMCRVFDEAKRVDGPVLVHVLTKKGSGYGPAERYPSRFHGAEPFVIETGLPKNKRTKANYTDVFSTVMKKLGERNPKVVAITAAMADGTGLRRFHRNFPDRFFDVGIAEAHATTFAAPWNDSNVQGAKRFITRVWNFFTEPENIIEEDDGKLTRIYHQTVKKVTNDFEALGYNTAISQMMIFVNEVYKAGRCPREFAEGLIKMLSCVCPHVSEEIWQRMGHDDTIAFEPWPVYDEAKTVEDTVEIAVQINGKTKGTLAIGKQDPKDEVIAKAKDVIADKLTGNIVKEIYVPGRIVNIVMK